MNIPKKYTIKIPKYISVLYCNEKKIITFLGPLKKKSLKIKTKIFIIKNQKLIKVSSTSFSKISNAEKKKIKAIQGTTLALIKQSLIEVSSLLYQKLKLIGVGYRVFPVQKFENQLLLFKLGYSHMIYFKIPNDLKIFCLKLTKLFICGNSYQELTQTAAFIRHCKPPEPYKGKGILYENEKIILKEGKKI